MRTGGRGELTGFRGTKSSDAAAVVASPVKNPKADTGERQRLWVAVVVSAVRGPKAAIGETILRSRGSGVSVLTNSWFESAWRAGPNESSLLSHEDSVGIRRSSITRGRAFDAVRRTPKIGAAAAGTFDCGVGVASSLRAAVGSHERDVRVSGEGTTGIDGQ